MRKIIAYSFLLLGLLFLLGSVYFVFDAIIQNDSNDLFACLLEETSQGFSGVVCFLISLIWFVLASMVKSEKR